MKLLNYWGIKLGLIKPVKQAKNEAGYSKFSANVIYRIDGKEDKFVDSTFNSAVSALYYAQGYAKALADKMSADIIRTYVNDVSPTEE